MGALEGVKVIDVGLLVQGPQAAGMLCDLGAEVVKVELPGMGDQARWIPIGDDFSKTPYFVGSNRRKRSATIDLRTPKGVEVFLKLVEVSDVLVSNFQPGTLEGWGLGFDVLSARNPRLIAASGSVFGTKGPGAQREGADLAGQAAGGLISTTGDDGTMPTPVGVTIADHIASQNMVAGILAALFARERTGKGQTVEVSLLGGQIYAQASEYSAYFLSGEVPGRANSGHPLLHAAYGIVETKDGYLALVGVPPALRGAFYEAIELPALADDERFASLLYTKETKIELFKEFAKVFPNRTTAEWCERLEAIGARYAPVNDYAAAAENADAWANGYFVEVEAPDGSTTKAVGSPIQLSDTPATTDGALPELGQHTEEVLLELGFSWDDIAAFGEAGAI